MTEPDAHRPFTTFNFEVLLTYPGEATPFCKASFSECDGLELTMTPKTIQEGGNNFQPIHLIGTVSYGQLTLKRGMTPHSFELWDWFSKVLQKDQHGVRVEGRVHMLSSARVPGSDQIAKTASFILERCLPVKLKAPPLNAINGQVGIEEMQIAYERLRIERPPA